jgi:hypothetical protein
VLPAPQFSVAVQAHPSVEAVTVAESDEEVLQSAQLSYVEVLVVTVATSGVEDVEVQSPHTTLEVLVLVLVVVFVAIIGVGYPGFRGQYNR